MQVPPSPCSMPLEANMIIEEREVRTQQGGKGADAQSCELATAKLRAIPGNQETTIEAKGIEIKSAFQTNKSISAGIKCDSARF